MKPTWLACVPEASADGQPEQRDPLPSYLDYRSNSSVRSYQTSYFPSRCAEGADSGSHTFELSVGTGADVLGGLCGSGRSGPEGRHPRPFCDGPLKPNTAYRYRSGALLPGPLLHVVLAIASPHPITIRAKQHVVAVVTLLIRPSPPAALSSQAQRARLHPALP